MSDNLTDRLREVTGGKLDYTNTPNSLRLAAANRIEELEAKLAWAVYLAFDECPFRDGTGSYNEWWYYRRKELEALGGQNGD